MPSGLVAVQTTGNTNLLLSPPSDKHVHRFQSYTNEHNIYLLDSLDDMSMGRTWDRFYNEAPGTL